MKRFLKGSVLALAITTLTLTPVTSRAAIGIGGVAPLVYAGIGAIGTGGLALWINESNIMAHVYYNNVWYYGLLIVGGVVLLDGQDGQEIEFTKLSSSKASELRLTSEEFLAYNAEIDLINILVSDASLQLSQLPSPTLEDSKAVWESLRDSVSPEAFDGM